MEFKLRIRSALALVTAPIFEEAVKYLTDRAAKEVLTAKTPEEREEKWREYHAFERVVNLVRVWAAEARTTPE